MKMPSKAAAKIDLLLNKPAFVMLLLSWSAGATYQLWLYSGSFHGSCLDASLVGT
jgi:hypothetical protein